MAISTYQKLSWGNSEAFYLSQVWSLYCRKIDWDWQLCDYGYYGYADPRFESDEPHPDILAFHPYVGDVQHIHIKAFEDYTFGDDSDSDQAVISEELETIAKSHSITDQTVSEYIQTRGHDFEPSTQEVVCVIPKGVYELYETHIKRELEENDLILWLIKANGNTSVWKEKGSHSNLDLDNEIGSRLKAYPSSNDILQYSRSTNRDRLEYEFISRLVRYCGRMNIRTISFSKADEIMVSTRPPILGHIPKEDREEEFWADFLYSMLNNHEILEQSEEEANKYVWKRKKFLNEPRYRHRILSKIRKNLDIDERGDL